jgi:pimeloyl-ACP methyl ester carboxylesterase
MIHALPGMGADHRMFPDPWGDLAEFAAHDWPAYSGETTLTDIAITVARTCGIKDGDTLIGTSLGGMVACEIAKIRKLRALFLVGSAAGKEEVNKLLAVLHPLAEIAPIEWLKFSAGSIPSELPRMFAGVDASFMRAMCAAIFQWEGLASAPVRCFRIHGKRDPVIPPPKHADLLLDGGHLISMTHPVECAGFVKAKLASPGT